MRFMIYKTLSLSFTFFIFNLFSSFAKEVSNLVPVGKLCHDDSSCSEELICVSERCKCKAGYVEHGLYCFREAYYGDICWFDDHCVDHRQKCSRTTENGPKRCICDIYHYFNESTVQCSPKANLTALLEEKYNTFEDISNHASLIFTGIHIIGLAVAVVGLFSFLAASIYCCRIRAADKKLQQEINSMIVTQGGNPQTFSTIRTQSQRKRQMNEASLAPVIGSDMVIA